MKFRSIAIFLAFVLLLGGVCTASGAAGGRDDPLLTKNYTDGEFTDTVLRDTASGVNFTVSQVLNELGTNIKRTTGSFAIKRVRAGGTATLDFGDNITLLSGAATVRISSGALVNVSVGGQAVNGILMLRHRYLACENLRAVVSFSQDSVIAVDGTVPLTEEILPERVNPFVDVKPTDWFYNDVLVAYERSFIHGMTTTTYEPQGTLTYAQCVKLAASLHELHYTGSITLTACPTGNWYQYFVDYAKEHGIITQDFENYDAPITRRDFAWVFYNTLPAESYTAINNIPDGAIPDIAADDYAYEEIYTMYRAGILAGYTDTPGFAEHAFGPDTTISRAEAAALINRLFDPSVRARFTI